MKHLLIVVLLLVAACNNKDGGLPERVAPPICGGESMLETKSASCLPPMADWLVEVGLANFPENVSLKINDIEILNECSGKNTPFTVNRNDPVSLEARDFMKPNKNLKFEITNLGSNCLEATSYYFKAEQKFQIFDNGESRELVKITLD